MAGAHRLNARYLLDQGLARPALLAYYRAILARPGFALRHWHRMLYAALSIFGGKRLLDGLFRWRQRTRSSVALRAPGLPALSGWPGIKL